MARPGMRLLTVLDPDYPENLRTVHDRPPLIFVAGSLESGDARSIAVVGARKATAQGWPPASAIAAHLADAGSPSPLAWPRASTLPPTRPRWPAVDARSR